MKKAALFFFVLAPALACAQAGYRPGDAIPDFNTFTVLNHPPAKSFHDLQGKITLIDFFGTWCIPCIRALPHLTSLQQQFGAGLRIVLISIEEKEKLEQFIARQKDLPFPIVVDRNQSITARFQPPAYPYTIVVNGQGKMLATTDAATISEAQVKEWLAQDNDTALTQTKTMSATPGGSLAFQNSRNPAVQLSQQFIYAAKTGDSAAEGLERQLQSMDESWLAPHIQSDAEKKAFWINVYNGYTQVLLQKDPGRYRSRGRFFSARQIRMAGHALSLDDIEHGLLRHSRIKWSLGYLGKPFPARREKKWRVDKLDRRIHFALNCGARSCPPIAFYRPEDIDAQLDLATRSYLSAEVHYDARRNVAEVPALLGWFRADFGGKKGMRKLLEDAGAVPPGRHPAIQFKAYDWSLYLNNYKKDNP